MGRPFRHRLRVRYNECDPQGVVFNANYVMYVDLTLTELWREAFGNYSHLMERGLDLVVGEIRVRYFAPARFDEELDIDMSVASIGTTSITQHFEMLRDADETKLVEGEIRHVMVHLGKHQKTPVPDDIRERLSAYSP